MTLRVLLVKDWDDDVRLFQRELTQRGSSDNECFALSRRARR